MTRGPRARTNETNGEPMPTPDETTAQIDALRRRVGDVLERL